MKPRWTSGGASSAMQGLDKLKKLKNLAGDRITILVGGGVRSTNIAELKQDFDYLHSACISADSENISTEEDVLLLEELAKEFRRSRDYDLVPGLYAAIKRNMAPANLLVHSGVEDEEMLKRMSSLPHP